jgi:hypothetical protein
MRTKKGRRSRKKVLAAVGRRKKQTLAGVGVVTTLVAPAMAQAEGISDAVDAVTGGGPDTVQTTISTEMRSFAHHQLASRVVRLAHVEARMRGKPLRHGFARRVRSESTSKLLRREHALVRRISLLGARHQERTGQQGAPDSATASVLAKIAACESSGNPAAIGGGGRYRGAYQFDQSTWESVGGRGDPAQASMAEQTRRAAILYARVGPSAWPVCAA